MPVIGYNFQKKFWFPDLEKSSEVLMLCQKMLKYFGHNKNFPQERGLLLFWVYWTLISSKKKRQSCNQNKVMSQSWEKGVTMTDRRMNRQTKLNWWGQKRYLKKKYLTQVQSCQKKSDMWSILLISQQLAVGNMDHSY